MADHPKVEEFNGLKYMRIKSGRPVFMRDALRKAETARRTLGTWVSRSFSLVSDEFADMGLEALEWLIDDLEAYVRALRAEIDRRRGNKSKEDRIALLRNTTGRTPEEAAEYRRKADQLESKLKGN